MKKKWIQGDKFVFLKQKEIDELKEDEVLEYLDAKLQAETDQREKLEKALEALDEKAKAEDVQKLKSELEEAKNNLMATLIKQGELIKLHQKGAGQKAKKSLNTVIKDALQEIIDRKNKGERNFEVELDLKAISDANITGDIPQSFREQGINKTPKLTPVIRQLIFNGTTSSDTVDWVEKTTETGQPIFLAELDDLPETETSYETFNTQVKKVGGMTKVSEEKLEDIEWMANEIRAELIERHDLVVDNQLLAGDGLGNNLKGILNYAVAFAAPTSFVNAVENANRTDVLRVAILQIIKAHHMPSAILLNPEDVAHMELEKNQNGDYVMPPFRSANGLTIKGLTVIESTVITAGNFLVADFSKAGSFQRRAPRLEYGLDGDDFKKDKRSVKLTERLAFRIKGRDLQAFVKGDFDTAIAAINKV